MICIIFDRKKPFELMSFSESHKACGMRRGAQIDVVLCCWCLFVIIIIITTIVFICVVVVFVHILRITRVYLMLPDLLNTHTHTHARTRLTLCMRV